MSVNLGLVVYVVCRLTVSRFIAILVLPPIECLVGVKTWSRRLDDPIRCRPAVFQLLLPFEAAKVARLKQLVALAEDATGTGPTG